MKQFSAIIIFLTLFVNQAIGQDYNREGEKTRDTIIPLLRKPEFTKTVILFRNDTYIVRTSLISLKRNIESWVLKHPHLSEDKNLLKLILAEIEDTNEVDAVTIAKSNKLEHRLEYRLADMLENGSCYIINQKSNEMITTIKVQVYSYYCGLLCGDGGRRFFINGILLLKVMDWIS
jgi:hypothetical protein